MAVKVLYKKGAKATYLGLKKRSTNALYFCTDTRELYKGDDLYTDGVRVVASYANLPALETAADGKLYFCEDTGSGYVLNAARDGWQPVFHGFDGDTIGLNESGLLAVKAVPLASVTGLTDELERIEKEVVAGGLKPGDEFQLNDAGELELKEVGIQKVVGLEDRLTSIEKAAIGGVHYKGSVATFDELPNDPKQGDLYEVEADNSEWCWNGEKWFEYGKTTPELDLKPVAKADLNPNEFEIKDDVLSLVGVSSEKVNYRGKSLQDVIDELSQSFVWEDMSTDVASVEQVESAVAQASDGDTLKLPDGDVTSALKVNKAVTMKGSKAGLAQNFMQEV